MNNMSKQDYSKQFQILYHDFEKAYFNKDWFTFARLIDVFINVLCSYIGIANSNEPLTFNIENLYRSQILNDKDVNNLRQLRKFRNCTVHEVRVEKNEAVQIPFDKIVYLYKSLSLSSKQIQIYLLSNNDNTCDSWEKYFQDTPNVRISNDWFDQFMKTHPEIDCVVSPANSFGMMDGGYDKAIIDYFGADLMQRVHQKIAQQYHGIQPVGTALSVPINEKIMLIHVPTMFRPERIIDPRIIFQCMHVTLCEAKQDNVYNIVIPAFGGATGRVPSDVIAHMMWLAYKIHQDVQKDITWENIYKFTDSLNSVSKGFYK